MKFERINENVIQCVLTQEEMRIQGINIDDLLGDRSKAEEFLEYILSKARYEVDFVTNGEILNVQMSVLKDGGVSMMISDDQNAAIRAISEQFKEKLQEFSKAFGEAKEAVKEIKDIYSKDKVIQYFISPKGEKSEVTYSFWARLSTIDDCVRMAKALVMVGEVKSSLYKYYGEYYINLRLSMAKTDVAHNVFIMSEYSNDVSSENSDHLMVSEHGNLIIKDTAVEELIKLS